MRDIGMLGHYPHHVSDSMAIANIRVAYEIGMRRFDSSLGGTGKCVTGVPDNQLTEGSSTSFTQEGLRRA
jgi:hypothetical protein